MAGDSGGELQKTTLDVTFWVLGVKVLILEVQLLLAWWELRGCSGPWGAHPLREGAEQHLPTGGCARGRGRGDIAAPSAAAVPWDTGCAGGFGRFGRCGFYSVFSVCSAANKCLENER